MLSPVVFIGVLAICFLLGSLPSGVIIGRVFFHTDIRETGSGNIGTTNAIRALGKKGGYIVFLLDFGKGLIAGLVTLGIAHGLSSPTGVFTLEEACAAALLGAACGHIFSPWLGFHGGKGIAVSVGCLFVTFGVVGALIELASFTVVALITKRISAGSLTAAVLCVPLSVFYFHDDLLACVMSALVGILVIWDHRDNIARLRAGTESTVGKNINGKGGNA